MHGAASRTRTGATPEVPSKRAESNTDPCRGSLAERGKAMAAAELLPDVVSLSAAISALEKGGRWRTALERRGVEGLASL